MKKKKRNFPQSQFSTSNLTKGSESSARLPSDYSLPTLAIRGAEDFQMIYSSDVNLTIQADLKEFSRKQATLLAGQSLYLVLKEGISILDWMVLEFLYSFLLGNKQYPTQIRNPKELELLLLLKVTLLSGTWMSLEGKREIPEDVRLLLESSQWIPNERTYSSRKSLYQLNKFLSVRIVPIDNLIDRSKGNLRYSSYCKGYGESSRMGRRQRTRPSAELDGEPVDLEREEVFRLPFSMVPLVLSSIQLERKYRPKKR